MFTGIIMKSGRVALNKGRLLRIKARLGRVKRGASVAINGTCLTVVAQRPGSYDFEVSPETFKLTNLGSLAPGDRVNVETSMKASDLVGGHWVTGHVDAAAPVLEKEELDDSFVRLRVGLPKPLRGMVALKGSIAVDGASLTVTGVGDGYFESVLIPETLERTTLGSRRPGERVNVEIDVMARYVNSILDARERAARERRKKPR